MKARAPSPRSTGFGSFCETKDRCATTPVSGLNGVLVEGLEGWRGSSGWRGGRVGAVGGLPRLSQAKTQYSAGPVSGMGMGPRVQVGPCPQAPPRTASHKGGQVFDWMNRLKYYVLQLSDLL